MNRCVLALFCASLPAAGAPPTTPDIRWMMDGATASEGRNRASKGDFGLQMLTTDDPEGFLAAWDGPTPPHLPTSTTARQGRPMVAMVVFTGCRTRADGNCDLAGEFTITDPRGASYGETFEGNVWNLPPPPGHNLQLSETYLGFRLEPTDPLGTYTMRAKVTDRVAGMTLTVEQSVVAVKD